MNISEISKEQFVEAYNAYPPNRFTKFAFRYFSKEANKEDTWLRKIIVGILLGLFGAGFLGTILNLGRSFMGIITYIFTGSIVVLVFGLFLAVFMNNGRIRKIRKKLGGISKYEYNLLVDKYLS